MVQRLSPQAAAGSRRCPQATPRLVVGFRGRALRRACSAARSASKGLSRPAALCDPSSRGEGCCSVKRAAEAKGGFVEECQKRLHECAGIGRSRACPRVGSDVAEVDRRQPDSEKRAPACHATSVGCTMRGDGSLVHGNLGSRQKRGTRSRERTGAEGRIATETSRDRSRDRRRSAQACGGPLSMEGALGCRICPIFTEGQREQPWLPRSNRSCESAVCEGRERQGRQRHGSSGSERQNHAEFANPTGPAEANRAS